jgi:hypothetical protein
VLVVLSLEVVGVVSRLEALIFLWEPPETHCCATCAHAVVGGVPGEPVARCEAGHGDVVGLERLIRPHPTGFRDGTKCPDWEGSG